MRRLVRSAVMIVASAASLLFDTALLARSPWTEDEKENARYIIMSMEEVNKATVISNKQRPFSTSPSDSPDMIRMVQHTEQGYEYAKVVTDSVLEKVHLYLRSHWRGEHQEGLRLILKSWEESDFQAQIMGKLLRSRFGDWWNQNKKQIKIPK